MPKNTKAQRAQEFSDKLSALLTRIRERAISQFGYNESVNIPAGRMKPDEAVENGVMRGVVSGLANYHGYGVEPCIQFAADLLEDVNAHTECAVVTKMLEPGWSEGKALKDIRSKASEALKKIDATSPVFSHLKEIIILTH